MNNKLRQNTQSLQTCVTSSLVTFDFDGTLSRKDVQEYALELISKGIDVWVVTSRYDELHKHRYKINPTNDDLWEVIDKLNIPRWKVRFTCMELKANYLFHTNSIFHLDDNTDEFFEMRKLKCKTKGVQVSSGGFQNKCNRILERSV
jgi:hypothetical protein